MNTKRLAKHYSALNVLERLKLLHDAERRGDTAESQTILEAATTSYEISETERMNLYLRVFYSWHVIEQSEAAVLFWHARSKFSPKMHQYSGDEPLEQEDRIWLASSIVAESTFAINRDGWRLFIKQFGVNEELIKNPLFGNNPILNWMDEEANAHDIPDEEGKESPLQVALRWLSVEVDRIREVYELPNPSFAPKNVESVAKGWHALVKSVANGFA